MTEVWESGGFNEPEDDFEFGLERVLDGIEPSSTSGSRRTPEPLEIGVNVAQVARQLPRDLRTHRPDTDRPLFRKARLGSRDRDRRNGLTAIVEDGRSDAPHTVLVLDIVYREALPGASFQLRNQPVPSYYRALGPALEDEVPHESTLVLRRQGGDVRLTEGRGVEACEVADP